MMVKCGALQCSCLATVASRLSTSVHGSLYWEGPNQALNRTGRRHGTTCADPINFGFEPSYMPLE